MAKLILGMEKGLHEKSDKVKKISTHNITIIFDDIFKFNIDGEILEDNIFNVNVVPKGIKLYNDKELVKKIMQK